MTIRVDRELLEKALGALGKVVNRQTSMDLLRRVALRWNGEGQLLLSATDLESFMDVTVPGTAIGEDGYPWKRAAPVDMFTGAVSSLVGAEVELSPAGTQLRLVSGTADFDLPACEVGREWPAMPEDEPIWRFSVNAERLKDAVKRVMHARLLRDNTRMMLQGVNFRLAEGQWAPLEVVATDTHRVAISRLTVPSAEKLGVFHPYVVERDDEKFTREGDILVPGERLGVALDALEREGSEMAEVIVSSTGMGIKAGAFDLRLPLLDARYVSIDALKANVEEAGVEREIIFARDALNAALRRAAVVLPDADATGITDDTIALMGFERCEGSGYVVVRAGGGDGRRGRDEINADFDGEPWFYAVALKTIREAISQVPGEKIRFVITGGGDRIPSLITPAEGDGYVAMMMPRTLTGSKAAQKFFAEWKEQAKNPGLPVG